MPLEPIAIPDFMAVSDIPCAQAAPEIFFSEEEEDENGKVISSVYKNEQAAKALCAQCPVRVKCLMFALEQNDIGIWGGTTERERRSIKRSKKDPRLHQVTVRRAARR